MPDTPLHDPSTPARRVEDELTSASAAAGPTVAPTRPDPPRRGVLRRTLAWSGRWVVRLLIRGPRWRRAIVWSVLLVALVLAVGGGLHWWQFSKAWNHHERGEYDEAIACYTNCTRLYPWNSPSFNNRGTAWFHKKDYAKALADYTEAIRLSPGGAAQYYRNRGVTWRAKKEYELAIADLNEAIRLATQFADAYNDRGLVWADRKEYDRAIADYNEAIRLNPGDAALYNNRGVAWSDKKEYDKAIADHTEAIRLNPQSANTFNNRGVAWSGKKEYDKAIADHTEAIRLSPRGAAQYYRNRGVTWRAKKDPDKAIADCTEAIRRNPQYAEAYNMRGCVWGDKREYERAIADFTEAIRLEPDVALYYSNRGRTWSHKGETDSAMADFQEAFRRAVVSSAEATARQDRKKLQGTWYTVSTSHGDTHTGEDRTETITYAGDKFVQQRGSQVWQAGLFKIVNATSKLRQIDYFCTEGEFQGTHWRAIYTLDRLDHQICADGGDDNRPREFTGKVGFHRVTKRQQE
jgi:uncharacterized protein (TIGR03067 family)